MKKKRTPHKVVMDFPASLLEETEGVVAELATNRGAFIRSAVDHKRPEEALAEGYRANAELDRRIAEEFSTVDYGDNV